MAERLKALLALKADALHVTLQSLAVMPEHVQMVVESDLGMAPAKLAAQFKGSTARLLRQEWRHLRSQLPSLWSRSYSMGSVGHVSEATVRRYLANQQGRHEMRKMMKYHLYPTDVQTKALEAQLGEACRLYNAALQERRDAYRATGTSLTYYDQAQQLKAIRAEGACALVNFSACQDVLRRVDKALQPSFVVSKPLVEVYERIVLPTSEEAAP